MSGTFANISVLSDTHRIRRGSRRQPATSSALNSSAQATIYMWCATTRPPSCRIPEKLKTNYKLLQRLIEEGTVVSGYAPGFGGLNEAIAKMSFSNRIGVNITAKEDNLFNDGNGSIVVESKDILNLP